MIDLVNVLAQDPYQCRMDWGKTGVQRATSGRTIVVIVDVLRFSTATIAAVDHGALIYPCAPTDDPHLLAAHVGATVAAPHPTLQATTPQLTAPQLTAPHPTPQPTTPQPTIPQSATPQTSPPYSLSPGSYETVAPGTKIVLPSLNGSMCSYEGQSAPYLFVGALVNAQATADAIVTLLRGSAARAVTVIACGELTPNKSMIGPDGPAHAMEQPRFAIEDYLGAGAILAALPFDKSPEARVCEGAYRAMQHQLDDLLWDSVSGRELRHKGLESDVRYAAQLNMYQTVPILRQERLERFT